MSKNILLFIFIIAIFLFSGCKVTSNEVAMPTHDSGKITVTLTKVPITVTPDMEPNVIKHTPDSLAIPTATNLVDSVSESETQLTCTSPPVIFNYREALEINFVTNVLFTDEHTLLLEGWTRGEQLVSQETSTTLSSSQGSFNVTFKSGLINLSNGNIMPNVTEERLLLSNPCEGDCFTEIWDQSPDGMWQITQVNSENLDEIGVWLVGLNNMIQLVPYVPASSQWQWANDNSLLWYVYPDRDYGTFADAIHLESPLTTNFHDNLDNVSIDPTINYLAFNPEHKTVVAIQELEPLDSKKVHIIDVGTHPFKIKSSQIISGVVAVEWSESMQSYLFNTIQENGLEFQYEKGSVLLTQDLLNTLYPSLANGNVSLEDIAPKENFVVSPSGAYVAIAYKNGEIKVFSCQ